MPSTPVRIVTAAVLILGGTGLAVGQQMTPLPPPAPEAPVALPLPPGRTVWASQDGSVLDITVDAAGTLTGTFVPGFPCGTAAGQPVAVAAPRPVTGTVSANALVWTVALPDCPSVGTWIGHYQVAGGIEEQLRTLWTLALVASPPGVGSTFAGSEVFVRQPPPAGAPAIAP
jgi:hypothetical protein